MTTHHSISTFMNGTSPVPRPLQADAYTVGSVHVSDEAKQSSVYQVVPRRGFNSMLQPDVKGRLIFSGLRRIIRDLFTVPVTMQEIEEADRFLETFHAGGTKFAWNRDMWVRVVEENNGVIPIKIEAFEEGRVAFAYEPIMQITAKKGYGEFAGYFESKLLHVWAASERITVLRLWKQHLKALCQEFHPSWAESEVDFAVSNFCHDFGDRAGICAQESEVLGMAHLMVFPGTDTTAGAYLDWASTGKPHGGSIHALAHRAVMGFESELQCHESLYELGKETGITAHVSDTYDYYATVSNLAQKLGRGEWKGDANIVVSRPDSGDAWECIKFVMDSAVAQGLYTESDGLKCATRLRWIQGDSMNWDSMREIISKCRGAGFSPFGFGAFGVGGHLRNSIKRDHTGLSMKLAAVGNPWRSTVKKSLTPAKSSIPGIVAVLNNGPSDHPTVYPKSIAANMMGEAHGVENLLKVWYDGTTGDWESAFKAPCLETNEPIRRRIAEEFDYRQLPTEVLSRSILAEREHLFSEGGW